MQTNCLFLAYKGGKEAIMNDDNRIKELELQLENCLVIARLTFGNDFRTAASDYGDMLRSAEKSLKNLDAIKPLATNKDGWLCPNCLEQNISDEPKKDDILTCSHCGHITLVE